MRNPVVVGDDLLSEAIGELEVWADSHDETDRMARQRKRGIVALIHKLDARRMKAPHVRHAMEANNASRV